MCSLVWRKKTSVSGFDFLGLRFCTVGDPSSHHFLSNGFNLQIKKKHHVNKKKVSNSISKSCASLCLVPLCQMAYMEADGLKAGVKMVQDSTAIKYEGWFQHLLVNRFIVQFLCRK